MICTRFAPSPTGYLHKGHAFAALYAARSAMDGVFLLRMEDIDPIRCKPLYADAIIEDLTWLGFSWKKPVRYQSQHFDDYHRALERVKEQGLLYPCFCTRKDIKEAASELHAPHEGEEIHYPGTCKKISMGEAQTRMATEPFVWRLDAQAACQRLGPLSWHDRQKGVQSVDPSSLDDVVLARKDAGVSYHLCSVVDDALQGITLVTRGEDLFSSTPIHRLLQALLNYETPDYDHHKLILDAQGKRLAKRDQSITVRALREQGVTADSLLDEFSSYF